MDNTAVALISVGLLFLGWLAATVAVSIIVKRMLRSFVIASKKYDQQIRRIFKDAELYSGGDPLPENLQQRLNGLLQQPINAATIATKHWTYFNVGWVTVLACTHENVAPYIIARRDNAKGNLARFWVDRMNDDSLVFCEGIVDKDFNIYCHENDEIDTLAILSPEVLDELRNAPNGVSVILKRDIVYFVQTGSYAPVVFLGKMLPHAQRFIYELEENLSRWAKSRANAKKIAEIESQPIGPTDNQRNNDASRGYFTKY